MKTVGIGSRNYTYRRVCYDLPAAGYEFRKVPYMPCRLFFPNRPGLGHRWSFFPLPRVDLFHLWNGYLTGKRKWVVSFESGLPRYNGVPRDGRYLEAVQRMGQSNCGALLPMSDYARNLFLTMNEDLLTAEHRSKIEIVHGAVEVRDELLDAGVKKKEAAETDELKFCMVGHDFFRKGGVPLLRAFRRLRRTFSRAQLVVVSSVEGGDYVTGADEETVRRTKSELSDTDGVTWHPRLPYADVLRVLSQSHFALLPTLDDTYGWSVLEAMSVGTPVITTDVCALPELVKDGENGCRIGLQLGENRRWIGMANEVGLKGRAPLLEEAYEVIENGLHDLVVGLGDPGRRSVELGAGALAHVRRQHDPESQGQKLAAIYDRVLAA